MNRIKNKKRKGWRLLISYLFFILGIKKRCLDLERFVRNKRKSCRILVIFIDKKVIDIRRVEKKR